MTIPFVALPDGFKLHALDEAGSTNDIAKQLANEGADHGTLVWCLRQTAGRGRRGRSWLGGEGNLYCSLVLRPDASVAEAARLSFLAAVAAADAVTEVTGGMVIPTCKWPNDLLIDGRKCAGILLEATGHPRPDYVIIGTGINLTPVVGDFEPTPTSLAQNGADVSQADMLAAYAWQLSRWLTIWQAQGFEPIRNAWLSRAAGIGGQVVARLGDGSEITGLFEGLDAEGGLVLKQSSGGTVVVTAGDVFLRNS